MPHAKNRSVIDDFEETPTKPDMFQTRPKPACTPDSQTPVFLEKRAFCLEPQQSEIDVALAMRECVRYRREAGRLEGTRAATANVPGKSGTRRIPYQK
jgi:hypothetical protein